MHFVKFCTPWLTLCSEKGGNLINVSQGWTSVSLNPLLLQYLWPVPCVFLWPKGLILRKVLEWELDELEYVCAKGKAELKRRREHWNRSMWSSEYCTGWLRFHLKSPSSGTARGPGSVGLDQAKRGSGLVFDNVGYRKKKKWPDFINCDHLCCASKCLLEQERSKLIWLWSQMLMFVMVLGT